MESKKGAERRQKILIAARQQFARFGYAGASMSQIAEAAGVTKAALYYHFPAKAALFRETAQHILASLRRGVTEKAEGIEDPLARLRALIHAHLDQFMERRDLIVPLYAMMFLPEEATDISHDTPNDCDNPVRDAMAACAREGLLEEDQVDDLATLLLGGIHHAGVKWLLNPRGPRPDKAFGDRLLCQLLPRAADRLVEAGICPPRPKVAAGGRRLRGMMFGLLLPLCVASAATGATDVTLGSIPVAVSAPVSASGSVTAIPGGVAPISLDDSIREALEANARLDAERQRRGELKGQMTQALSTGLPTIDLSGSWFRSRDPSFAFDETFGGGGDAASEGSLLDSLFGGMSFLPAPEDIPAQTYWRASVNAHWELSPGRVYNAIKAAGLGIERQDLLLADAENRTIEAVMSAYYSVVMAGEHLSALDADLASRQEFLDVTRRRFALGFSTALDTLRAAVSVANLAPQRRSAAQRLRDAGARLNVLMGREALAPLAVESEIPVETASIDAARAAGRVSERPDIRQLDLFAHMLRKNRGAQKSAHRPSVSADASYGYVTKELDELTDKGHDVWSASLTLKVPLFDGFLTKGQVQETEAWIRRTRREHEEATRQARLEVLSLLGDLGAAHANLSASELNMTAAEDALEQITLRYQLGKTDYLSVLNVQSERSLARSNLIEARNDVLTLTASLKRALGFAPTVPLAEIGRALPSPSVHSGSPAEGRR
jgi:outer membrane protein TolC